MTCLNWRMNYLEKDVNQLMTTAKKKSEAGVLFDGSNDSFRLYEEFSIIVCEFKEFFCGCLNNMGVFSFALAYL